MRNVDEQFIKEVVSAAKCKLCGKPYDRAGITVLSHHEDTWFVSVTCTSCQKRCLVSAVVREPSEVRVETDLTPEESRKFAGKGPIEACDALNMHYFLDSFDGDFVDLFKAPGPGG